MKLKKYGLLVASLGLLASCANDNVDGPNVPSDGVGAVVSLNVKAVGTRTETPNQKTEVGTDEENKISSVLLVVADKNKNQKTVIEGEQVGTKWNFNFAGDDFLILQSLPEMNLYAVCNLPLASYKAASQPSAAQRVLTLASDVDTYWAKNNFLMSNSSGVTRTIDVVAVKNGEYATTPKDMGTIEVQRAVARLDLAKGQPKKAEDWNAGDGISVKFESVSLVNLSKKFYLYKEVGKPGAWTMFGTETYDAATDEGTFVNDPKYSSNGSFSFDLINQVTANLHPTDLTYKAIEFGDDDIPDVPAVYNTWRYATPNTAIQTEDQKNGRSTGIVYRAQILGSGAAVEAEYLYTLDGVVLGDIDQLKDIVNTPSGNQEAAISTLVKTFADITKDEAAIVASLTSTGAKNAGFEVYPAEGGKFYCYYYYWVRHNGVGTNSDQEMHPMEFGVVRNNVYKIAVTAVKGLGKPCTFSPDPDQDDDPKITETVKEANITVTISVLPWEVRVDNIEF